MKRRATGFQQELFLVRSLSLSIFICSAAAASLCPTNYSFLALFLLSRFCLCSCGPQTTWSRANRRPLTLLLLQPLLLLLPLLLRPLHLQTILKLLLLLLLFTFSLGQAVQFSHQHQLPAASQNLFCAEVVANFFHGSSRISRKMQEEEEGEAKVEPRARERERSKAGKLSVCASSLVLLAAAVANVSQTSACLFDTASVQCNFRCLNS